MILIQTRDTSLLALRHVNKISFRKTIVALVSPLIFLIFEIVENNNPKIRPISQTSPVHLLIFLLCVEEDPCFTKSYKLTCKRVRIAVKKRETIHSITHTIVFFLHWCKTQQSFFEPQYFQKNYYHWPTRYSRNFSKINNWTHRSLNAI